MRAKTDRRRFIKGLAGAGVAAATVAAQDDGATAIDVDAVRAAERIAGLSFNDDERKDAAADLEVERRAWAQPSAYENGLQPSLGAVLPKPAARVPAKPGAIEAPSMAPTDLADEEIAYLPAWRVAELIRAGSLTSERLTRIHLERLKRFDPSLFCVVTLLEKRALEQARRADAELAAGHLRSALHGVTWGVKDLFAVSGHRTTWGAKPFENQVIDETAEIVRRLDDAGCVLLAKLSCGALAMGDVWFGGRTRNPWNTEQGSSGSSAGSAASVAAGLVGFAIGTETLGSIVSPSARCGVTGLRPTFGRVPRSGGMALCWSMDKAGPMARTVRDCELVLEIIAGADGVDLDGEVRDFAAESARPLEALRVGVFTASFAGRQTGEHERAVLADVERMVGKLRSVALPSPDARARLMLDVEAAAAFDGITRDGRVRELVAQGRGAWPRSFRAARFVPAVDYVESARGRTRLKRAVDLALADVDVFVSTSFGANVLLVTNLTGHPCLVLPCGFAERGGRRRPVSISFIAQPFAERELCLVARAWQESTDHHRQRPL